ncbi:hypothetical protein V501_07849 [Pseudogymnoascus sp. VKM F-4519 (FW-2642)]|nr:hypothetical protein V501_07849 [Pseudogymnoascus sp. VKM F-4519 (FW-2642)]
MQFFHQLLAFISLLAVSNACLILDGFMTYDKKGFTGTLNDNGTEVCKWNIIELNSPSNFANCLPGFAAYITNDATIVGYSNHGKEFAFRTRISTIPAYPGLPINFSVTAKNYGC